LSASTFSFSSSFSFPLLHYCRYGVVTRTCHGQEEIGQLCFQFVESSASAVPPTVQLPAAVARTLPATLQQRIQWAGEVEGGGGGRGGGEKGGTALLTVTRDVYNVVMHHVPVEALRRAVYLKEHALSQRVIILERCDFVFFYLEELALCERV